MSPTLSDDLLVRDLHERADRVLPAMALDPTDVLVAGRRRRNGQTALRSVAGVLAASAFVVGALQLAGPQRTDVTPAYPDPAFVSGTFSIRVADDTREVDTDAGPAVDLGIPVAARWNPIGALTYALRAGTSVDGKPGGPDATGGLWLGSLAGDGTTAVLAVGGVNAILEPGNRSPVYSAMFTDHDAYVLGVRTPALAGARFDLVVQRDGRAERTEIPTFRVPGFDHDVWFVALTDPEVEYATWPFAFIEVTAQDGTTSQWDLDGQELEASGADTPAIQVAENVQEIETDIGPATDLGVTVEDLQLGNPNQALRYIISVTTVGAMAPEAAGLTPEELAGPAVLLSTLAADGTTSAGAGGDLGTHRALSDGSPMYQSGFTDHDAYVLGRLSPGSGATLELVVEHAEGAERTLIPAFRLPGLPDDFFFVALHHDKVTFADWPTIYLELTAQDGATRQWTLAGIELSEDVPKPTDVPADQG